MYDLQTKTKLHDVDGEFYDQDWNLLYTPASDRDRVRFIQAVQQQEFQLRRKLTSYELALIAQAVAA